MTTVFFTSDTHFDHASVIKKCNRPFSDVDEMNEGLIERWNAVVRPGDSVYHLGDFALTRDAERVEELASRLNGSIHWIFGNHDVQHLQRANGFAWKGYYQKVRVPTSLGPKKSIVLLHCAMRVWEGMHGGNWHLYGHSHGSLAANPDSLSFDVGVDCWDYRPIAFEQVEAHMKNFSFVPIDHHGR